MNVYRVANSTCSAARGVVPHQVDTRELVVLVHGMGRTPLSMWPVQRNLERAGYRVINWGYSSYCCTIAELGTQLREDLDARRGDAQHVLLKPLPELTTDSLSTVRQLPVPRNITIGVIAGRRDGKVTIAETRLPGDVDSIIVSGGHSFMMLRPHVRQLVRAFLRDGHFSEREQRGPRS